jgi:fructosamine-3-kinase
MALQGSLIEQVAQHLTGRLGTPVDVEHAGSIGGGSINDAWRLETDHGRFFLKTNHADRFPSLFEAEADGLARLRAANALPTPEVLGHGEDQDTSWLLLEWLEEAPRRSDFWTSFGRQLARQHRHTRAGFGLERDNYIGSLKQSNRDHAHWPSFFIQERLEPQFRMARDRRKVEAGTSFRAERLFAQLDRHFPEEPPALLHGDLWNGNFMSGPDGAARLIDPAVYYGHREMDLAMTRLFGGFDPGLLSGYEQEWPLQQGWEERVDLCNLYPLLVHVNLFGGHYVQQVEAVLRRYV